LRSPLRVCHGDKVDDRAELRVLNERFIAACRAGSWERLRVILDADFGYLDGRTGQMWEEAHYVADLRANPSPSLRFDEVIIHVAGQTATVSARTRSDDRPGRANRYLDTYARRDGRWLCVHACVWPLAPGDGAR
jgi:ketosteroid isomerase-like protein